MTPVWAGTAPLDSSIRGLLTSGSLLSWLREAAAVSSVPVSHTRLTTTGVDELAWAARSCNGFVRAGKKDKRKKIELMWQVTRVCLSRKQENATIKCNTWARTQLYCSNPFCKAHSNLSSVQIYQTGKLFSFKGELHPFYPLSNKALPAKHSSPDEENQSSAKTTARLLER